MSRPLVVRMQDVADHAGVSTRTVSNVVNGYHYVKSSTRERVQAALDELGYEVNTAARSLKSGRTGMIALVIPELRAPYFAELAQAVVRAADRRDLTPLIEITEGTPDHESRVLAGGHRYLTDGVLFSPLSLPVEAASRPRRSFPLVVLGESSLGEAFDHVGIDNVAATRTVVDHLLAIGRTRICGLGADPALPAAVIRERAFRDALGAAGLRPHSILPTPSWERQSGAAAIDTMLSSGREPPDAVFAFSDTLALGALRALLRGGVPVPSRIAVASIDNVDEATYATPSLTTIAPALDQLADTALDMLTEQIDDRRRGSGARRPRQEATPFRLVVRESTGG